MPKEKELTLQDAIEGDVLKNINKKIRELESKKISLENEIDKKREELSKMVQDVEKEINLKIQKASEEAQEKINEAGRLLKEAEKKLKTVEQREKDTEAINQLSKDLEERTKAFVATQKEAASALASALERGNRANLIIAQYEKKLVELEELRNKK